GVERTTADRAGEVVFGGALRQVFETGDEKRGIRTVHHRHGTGLAAIPIALRDDRAVAALVVELHGDAVLAMHLYTVDGRVHPARVRITHDDDAARADISAAVVLVPDGSGKFLNV